MIPPFDTAPLILLLWAAVGYFLGSIPFGMVLAKLMGLGNLRDVGSGNIGATNVLRTGNKTAAALTLILDGGKGAAALILARLFAGEDAAHLAAFAAFLGHCFPIWLMFRGGKGVATFFGIIFALYWPLGLACAALWLTVAAIFRYSSLAALVASALSPLLLLALGRPEAIALCLMLTLLIYTRHVQNIKRLFFGTEFKIKG
ncbi:glycerol-3-phosphate 1-O-acyltransferase PlsY [Parasulfitobacter algicola]|uniref:Glycerol-3-phosphate acyltransferase n=1 Tax=Parasulfitobacter algicola TaxID=2614809 RepID=A0ABX2IW21_9RHOB|nr:glycerol-3-phosphate 1-O-acyltransferase PlsY [Sulfitobacter algicola]NSX56495.1 glycerol-3-phosphate 1-O-acyltransferase PlsY [Sulfitobacter algicola]